MMAMILVDGLVYGASCVAAGVVVVRSPASRPTGAALAVGGLALIAAALVSIGAPHAALRIALAAAFVPITVALVMYPDGRIPPIAGPLTIGVGGLSAVGLMIKPADGALPFTAISVVVVALGLCFWWRFEHSTGDGRSPLLWFVTAMVVLLVGDLLFISVDRGDGIASLLVSLATNLLMPVSIVIGLRWPDVLDVRKVMAGCVLYGVAAITVVAVFAGEVSLLDLAGAKDPSAGTLAVLAVPVAVGFHPLTVLLRGIIDRLLFGDRPDPITAVTHVGQRLGDEPILALRALREALILPFAQLSQDDQVVAVSGKLTTSTREVPLLVGATEVGLLTVGLRSGEISLSTADERILRILTPALAQAAHARTLADALADSRERAIGAIEEERRRLHRDLHDGLGPTLTGVAYSADAARNLIRTDPEEADALLRGLRADTASAINEVRRVVQDLRPPALDELGLVQAVRLRAAVMHSANGKPLTVQVEAAQLPPLPAAVEVAAYRITVEAMTNAARHARCANVRVGLKLTDETLLIDVTDDGHLDEPNREWAPGSGTESMRERAEQLGGTFTGGPTPRGGQVQARLPILIH
jgi:two-component system, NarL family, sensor kinase